MKLSRHLFVVPFFAVALSACSGSVTDTAPPGRGLDSTAAPPTGVVQRTSLTVRVEIDPADRSLASVVGISTAGLTVRLTRSASTDAPRTTTTDAAGTARFEQLLDGTYSVSVERSLTSAEIARLDADARDVTVFSGGIGVPVSPPTAATATVALVGARRGGLVISEVMGYIGNPPYNWGQYFEIYNNGDSTVYLDGYVLAHTGFHVLHTQNLANCDEPTFQRWRQDTTRLWATGGIEFPGSGLEFPVLPGQSRIYASDATDHQASSGIAGFADLSRADFEHVGIASDIDNPLAANVTPVFGEETGAGGRGMRVSESVWFLARRGAVQRAQLDSAFPLNPPPPGGLPRRPWALFGVPRDLIVDVFPLYLSPERQAFARTTTSGLTPICRPFVQPAFDRLEAELYDYMRPGAMRRRSLGRTADGREILMRTKTAARDWELSPNLLTRWRRTP